MTVKQVLTALNKLPLDAIVVIPKGAMLREVDEVKFVWTENGYDVGWKSHPAVKSSVVLR